MEKTCNSGEPSQEWLVYQITPRAQWRFIQEVIKEPCTTSKELQASLASIKVSVHDSTIRKRLGKNGTHRRVPRENHCWPKRTQRLVSHLPKISWLSLRLEKLIRDYICSVLPASLDPLQFAYRSHRSTDDAIAFTLHTALSHLENKNIYVRMIFVDYSSAFNTIVPATLVAKLQTLGLNRSLCSWILDFLTDRSQVVRMGNNTSSPLILNTGAPQGCVLSPLLYSLYTHDCTATHSSNIIVKFADDTAVIDLITDNDEKAYIDEVSTLTKWCQENHLSLNIDKTKELVVDYRRQSREHTPITIDKTPVERALSSSAFTSPRISHGLLTQMQCWRRHISVSSSWDGWGSLERAPASSDHSTPALWRASWPAASPPGLETAPLATAGLCKGSCELPATLLEVSFPPSRISTPGGVQGKPGGLSKTPATRPTDCSLCCPQGDVSAASDPALADWG